MSAPTPQRKPPTKRPFVLPLAAGLVVLTIVREVLPKIREDINPWVVFVTALAFGYIAYSGTEWYLMKRQRQRGSTREP